MVINIREKGGEEENPSPSPFIKGRRYYLFTPFIEVNKKEILYTPTVNCKPYTVNY